MHSSRTADFFVDTCFGSFLSWIHMDTWFFSWFSFTFFVVLTQVDTSFWFLFKFVVSSTHVDTSFWFLFKFFFTLTQLNTHFQASRLGAF